MNWTYQYDAEADETTIYWDGQVKGTLTGEITEWRNGYPLGDARTVVADAIQGSGTPDRIRMQYDFNYGFEERDPETE